MIDAGDLFGDRNRKDQEQTEFLAAMTARLGYDAIGLGERDLNYGFEFLERMITEHRLPFTSANVRNAATGELILPEYIIVERGGLRVGIFSVMGTTHRIVSMSARDIEYQVDDPAETMRALVPRLREQCDTVVLLSHIGERPTEVLLQEIDGVDIALLGHTLRSLTREHFVRQTLVLASVHEGRTLGHARVSIGSRSGQVQSVQVEVISLDDTIPDDSVMRNALQGFEEKIEQARQAQRAAFPRNLGSVDEQFLGDNNCRACHTEIHAQWRQTGHANAFTSLRARSMQNEPECLSCHTTGYRHHGGYDEMDRNNLVNVQCESCHGYGTAHARDGSMLELARESCTQCHDNTLRPCHDESKHEEFDYARFWQRIAH